jgi:vacuolar protein sorting-associated protein VTA1
VQALNGSARPVSDKARQPSVIEVPDEHDQIQRSLARKSLLDESIHPSRSSSVPRPPEVQVPSPPPPVDVESFYQSSAVPEVSPSAPAMDRTSSAGGGYFPQVTDAVAPSPPPGLPPAPSNYPSYSRPPNIPDVSSLPPPGQEFPTSPQMPKSPDDLMQSPPPASFHPSQSPYPPPQPPAPGPYPPPSYSFNPPSGPSPAFSHPTQQPPLPQTYVQPRAQPAPVAPPANVVVDEVAIAKAQKHARWAISALNFEDVNTAIWELRGALESLGAQ